MATTTPAFNIKVPQRPDPADLTADLAISYTQIDSVLSQVNGTANQASTDASQAEATAAQAMAVVASYDDPIHVGPSEPTGDEKLWADTDEPAPQTAWAEISGKPNAFPSVELVGPVDLNTLTTPGTYWETSSGDVAAGTNWPTDRAAQVVVTANPAASMITQTVTEYTRENPRQWLRTFYSATWGPWHPGGVPLPTDLGTVHLDTITKPGDYTQTFLSRSTKAQGYPLEGKAGILSVRSWNYVNGSVICTFTPWTADPICRRAYYQGVWYPWTNALGTAV